MRLMITGATGFLGSRALSVWKETHTVEVLPSALLRGEMTRERTEALAAALSAFAPEVLLHTAAISDTGFAERSPDVARQANVELPQILARLCAAQGCKMLFCSSDQVYNGCPGKGPFAESEPLAPLNVYGRQKLEAEARVLDAAPDAVALRLTWMYDLPGYGLPTHRNLLLQLLGAAVRRQPLALSTTDFRGVTYARQVVANLPAAFTLAGSVYNFGSESTLSTWGIANRWCTALGADPALLTATEGKPRSLCMDCARISANGILFDDSAEGLFRCLRDYALETV